MTRFFFLGKEEEDGRLVFSGAAQYKTPRLRMQRAKDPSEDFFVDENRSDKILGHITNARSSGWRISDDKAKALSKYFSQSEASSKPVVAEKSRR